MELNILVDNTTIDKRYSSEPGLSILIEDENTKILFDTGNSDIFLKNAVKMGKDLTDLNYIVLSHNHIDHTGGIESLIEYYADSKIDPFKKMSLVAHPEVCEAVYKKFKDPALLSKASLSKFFHLKLSRKPQSLGPEFTFLGEIPRLNNFESMPYGRRERRDESNLILDDSALVYHSKNGLVIITGCSHAGICNIIEYAKEVCDDHRVVDIIGGFHLLKPKMHQLEGTVSYFGKLKPEAVHACHCTDLKSKKALSKVVNIKEVGAGFSISY
ncbi:MAG: MBL fold metallo-hydrolase [Desulfobacterales bacterium]|nr:MBL fold metallo-hydrolase [Desulfobacterales bacterium]